MGLLRMYSMRGGIGGLIKRAVPKLIKSPVLKAIPGVGTIATVAGAGASVYGAVSAGRAAARSVQVPLPGGGTLRPLAALPGGTPLFEGRKKYRRMNPMNFRALNRAVRRLDAAEKMFRKVLRVRTPEKANRSIVPKTRKRK